MRIGVLTSGGDVPGLNACIKAIVTHAEQRNWTVTGIMGGWRGLLEYDPQGDPEQNARLSRSLVTKALHGIENVGGTILHTTRLNPVQIPPAALPKFLAGKVPDSAVEGHFDCTDHILEVLDHMDIDVLIPIGGDGSLRFSAHLSQKDFPVISIPKTMDNDVFGTDYCIGFSTCVTRCVDSINKIRTTAASHERVAIIELFGRYSGEPALLAGYVSSANRVLIPEVPIDLEMLSDLIAEDQKSSRDNYAIAVVSEGARLAGGEAVYGSQVDIYGRKKLGGIGNILSDALRVNKKIDVLNQPLAYLLRSGEPDALDKLVAMTFGTMAIQLIDKQDFGKMTVIRNGNYAIVDATCVLAGKKSIDIVELYDEANYRPHIRNVLGRPMYL
ncbi:ATP-dependent 6-phosphofructokinase [Emcibacter sp.]|uniref:6-phosphofructokinase n=1 Tax=Emcibacter sp. TaxID=1979954 RepID=UPI002AA88E01|nr:ATP-dependent 6-phosphofructokinase [Emcibacter sp.]